MVIEAHCANYRKTSRLEKPEISNPTFTKNGDIIHTRHPENPQRRTLPGKHTQEEQPENKNQENYQEKKREEKTKAMPRKQRHVHTGIYPIICCTSTILVFLSCPFNSSHSSLSALHCLQTSHYWCSFPGLTPPWIISEGTFDFQGILYFLNGGDAIRPCLVNRMR